MEDQPKYINTNSGPKQESVFSKPITNYENIKTWNQELPKLFNKADENKDDRSLVLVAALMIEHFLDGILYIWIPGFDKLKKEREFSFSFKLNLLAAFKLIPKHIIDYANGVRKIRNEFAHNLEANKFEELEKKYLDSIKSYYLNFHSSEKEKQESTKIKFKFNAFVAINGIRSYNESIKALKDKIDDEEFIKNIIEEKEKNQKADLKRATEEGLIQKITDLEQRNKSQSGNLDFYESDKDYEIHNPFKE